MENKHAIQLQANALSSHQIAAGDKLQCLSGRILVTLSNLKEDFCLEAGQSLNMPHAGLLVIEALTSGACASLIAATVVNDPWHRLLQNLTNYTKPVLPVA